MFSLVALVLGQTFMTEPLPNWVFQLELGSTDNFVNKANQGIPAIWAVPQPEIRIGDVVAVIPEDSDITLYHPMKKPPKFTRRTAVDGVSILILENKQWTRKIAVGSKNQVLAYRIFTAKTHPKPNLEARKWFESLRSKFGTPTTARKFEAPLKGDQPTASRVTYNWEWGEATSRVQVLCSYMSAMKYRESSKSPIKSLPEAALLDIGDAQFMQSSGFGR